jgi:ATP phosphoribosyltransferase regulatory subunit HisZ
MSCHPRRATSKSFAEALLDTASSYGYELVIPPLLEHLESLLTGTGEALDLQTFKLVDQLSGRMLGVRADTTPQVARIDAHLLNRAGVARLCYCGPVLHTRPDRPHATREPLQLGAEIYGHSGREADLEILLLALDCLKAADRSPGSASIWPMPASLMPCWPAYQSVRRFWPTCMRRWPPRTRPNWPR